MDVAKFLKKSLWLLTKPVNNWSRVVTAAAGSDSMTWSDESWARLQEDAVVLVVENIGRDLVQVFECAFRLPGRAILLRELVNWHCTLPNVCK